MPTERDQGAVGTEALLQRVEELTAQVDQLPDPLARRMAGDLVGAIIEMYGQGLTRVVEILDEDTDGAEEIKRRLADDGIVASLLLIHDLYPVPISERVNEALDGVRPYMESHGGNVELISLDDGVARIRLEGSCDGCPASSSTLELAIKTALDEAAPDLTGIEVEGLEQDLLNPVIVTGTPLPMAGEGAVGPNGASSMPPPSGASAWHELNGEVDGLQEDQLVRVDVGGTPIVVAMVEGSLLAYLDSCPSCQGSIADGELDEGMLVCPGCERRYFLPRAGRSLDDEKLHLGPVPLLASGDEGVKVALAG